MGKNFTYNPGEPLLDTIYGSFMGIDVSWFSESVETLDKVEMHADTYFPTKAQPSLLL